MKINFIDPASIRDAYDLVVVGTGFGSLFFVQRFLERSGDSVRVLLLERGGYMSREEQLAQGRNFAGEVEDYIDVPAGHKPWNFTLGLGGGTLCWWGQTPRFHPSDFEMLTKYGVGRDWPVSYADLEPYYCEAEYFMGVSGDSVRVGPYWRSRPYPMPAQPASDVDLKMRELYPDQLAWPNARVSIVGGPRPQCCAVGNCRLCPMDSKFTALNGFTGLFSDPRVNVAIDANVHIIETEAGVASGVVFTSKSKEYRVKGKTVVLGANAIFNPMILERSGITHAVLGKAIHEQYSVSVEVQFADLIGINGGTSSTGFYAGYLDGPHRSSVGAASLSFDNRFKQYGLRTDLKKLANTVEIVVSSENLPESQNYVEVPSDWKTKPIVHHLDNSEYAKRGVAYALERLPALLAPLNVESISKPRLRLTESHIQGTTPMGKNPDDSIVDTHLAHHKVRNLFVVGTSVFATCSMANPSLTAAALSLRAADWLTA